MAKALDRICVSTWSFHKLFEEKPPAIDIRDFPGMIADRYDVRNIELVLPHLQGSDPAHLAQIRSRIEQAGSRVVNMPLDYGQLWNTPALSSKEAAERDAAIALYRQGIDTAERIGCSCVRCDPGNVDLGDPSPTIDSYKRLVEYAAPKGIHIVVENHGAISQNPEVLIQILQAAGVGALPDFGNFPDEATRERGLRLMFPLAADLAHAKVRQGGLDFAKCLRIAKDSGFTGVFSIEAPGTDPYEEVQNVINALVSNL